MPIEGPLKELAIQDVLQMLDLAQKSGVLTVRSERMNDEAVVHLLDGELVFASRRRSMRLLGQQLLREGKLEERELERALDLQRRHPKMRLGAILVEMGCVDRSELDRQLRFQIEETIYDILAWDEGYFRFEETSDTPDSPVRVRVDSLLMEGARRLDEWTRLESRIPSADCIPELAPTDGTRELVSLDPEAWEVLAEVDGERDLRLIAAELGRSAFDVAKTVDALVRARIVRVRDQQAAQADSRFQPLLDELERTLADGDLEAAERQARELQRTHPGRADLPLVAGRAQAAQGRVRAAVESFERAVALDPLSLDAHYHLGMAAIREGDLERAAQAWHNFLRLRPSGDRARYVERAVAALDELRKVIESAPSE